MKQTRCAWCGDDPFIVLNSDNLYPVDVLARLRGASGPAVPGFERDSMGLSIDRLGAYALVEAAADGCLARVREKPGAAAIEAQRPATAPETAPSGKPPDTVMIEGLTWAEVRDYVAMEKRPVK